MIIKFSMANIARCMDSKCYRILRIDHACMLNNGGHDNIPVRVWMYNFKFNQW